MQPQPPQPYRPQAPMPYVGMPTNTLAVVSLAAGISAFVITHFIGAGVAILTGHIARRQIRETGEGGGGFALAGLILGYVYYALLVLVLIVVVLFLLGLGALFVGTSQSR
jgi:hypothetical protein